MGQFKPMVKMMTDEPSVILKLKKGGKVAVKGGKDSVHKAMSGANPFAEAESGMAPKKPSMAERRKAMNPNMYAKGGKVARKQMGGGMPVAMPGAMPGATAPAPAPMQAMGRQALAGMAPAQRMRRAAMVKRAMSGMKDGGSAECKALEKELKHHESMSASKAHGKASGGSIDKAMTKTTIEGNAGKYAKTKMDTSKKDRAHGTGGVKEGMPGGYAMGGSIMGNEKAYEKTKMVTAGKGKTSGSTGGVKMGNAGGFKSGGKVPGLGNAIEGGNWENRPANSAKPGVKNTTTGGVKNGNGGGFKMGGRASKKAYATGGTVDTGKPVAMPRKPVSRPIANSLQSGTFAKGGKVEKEEKPSLRLIKTHTGPKGHVAKVYKDREYGEHRVKFFSPEGKHMTNADYHTDDVSDAHDTAEGQLNRYKMGGKAKKFDSGGSTDDKYFVKDPKATADKASRELEEALNPLSMVKELAGKAKNYFMPKGESVTKTKESVTVSPALKKRGGGAC